jgi:hypothetical protein
MQTVARSTSAPGGAVVAARRSSANSCGEGFLVETVGHRFCSGTCRQRAHPAQAAGRAQPRPGAILWERNTWQAGSGCAMAGAAGPEPPLMTAGLRILSVLTRADEAMNDPQLFGPAWLPTQCPHRIAASAKPSPAMS